MRGDDLRYLFHLTRPRLLRAHQARASHRIRYFAFSCSLSNIFRRLWFISQIAESVMIFTLWFFFLSSFSEPRWASVNRGVLICDECCSVHRSLGRHSSQVRHLMHTPWPPTQLQVTTPTQETSAFSSVMSCQRLRCLHDRLLLAHDLLWLQVHIQQASVFLLKRNLSTTVVHQISQSCIDFCPEIESVYSGKDLLAARQHPAVEINGSHYNRFLFHFTLDGPDVIQQRSKFNMGALSSGPCVCNEWKTQGQPSGQTAVSHYCLKIKTEYFLVSITLALLIH